MNTDTERPNPHMAWIVEHGAVSLPLGHPSRVTVLSIFYDEHEAAHACYEAAREFEARMWPVSLQYKGFPALTDEIAGRASLAQAPVEAPTKNDVYDALKHLHELKTDHYVAVQRIEKLLAASPAPAPEAPTEQDAEKLIRALVLPEFHDAILTLFRLRPQAQAPKDEPVAWIDPTFAPGKPYLNGPGSPVTTYEQPTWTPLYARPTVQAQLTPTDGEKQ